MLSLAPAPGGLRSGQQPVQARQLRKDPVVAHVADDQGARRCAPGALIR
jgi:hypothetical protein